jgi:hypothetical protein
MSADVMLRRALRYARFGWRVFPLHAPTGAGCSCGKSDCTSVGKHPRTTRGVHDATTDDARIAAWWRQWPDASIGIATGNGLAVLDVDPRHGGDDSLRNLEDEHGEISTLTARTGGGGLHLYLVGELPGRGGFLPGLDLKSTGGYVVAPPSLHASGNRYEWIATEDMPTAPQPVPHWLHAVVSPPPVAVDIPRTTPPADGTRYVAAAIEAECLAVATAGEGERNNRLNAAAYSLARFVASGQATASGVRDALFYAARHAGLNDIEIQRTIRSAFRARRAA